MHRIYLDNAATSWPKPESVYTAVQRAMRELGAPAGRGAYDQAGEVERVIGQTRKLLAEMLEAESAQQIIFTANGTASLNLALHGLLRPGDHVVTSLAEHNSVLRPLRFLEEQRGIAVTRVKCDSQGLIDPREYRQAITSQTRLVTLIHASNVTGALQPAEEIGKIANECGAFYLLDAAQSLGHLPVDFRSSHADLIAAPGHKGLLGPLGTGVLAISSRAHQELLPLLQGGTGTQSENDQQPKSSPDKYESGNLNVPGIFGLQAGLVFLKQQGLGKLREHELKLTEQLLAGFSQIPGVTVHGPPGAENRVGVVSISQEGFDPQEIAAMLDASASINVRAGFQCAPGMHQCLGTAGSGGTIRFSSGPFTTSEEIAAAIAAVAQIAEMQV